MRRPYFLVLHCSIAAMLMLSVTVQALPISHTWDFRTTCYANGKCNDTLEPVGNVRTAPSDNGLNVKVSAYAFTDPNGTGPSIDAWLGQYVNPNGGLGVTNSSGDGSHTVDNVGYSDYVVFEFSSPVNVTSYYLNRFDDADSTWYVGNLAPGFDFTGKTLAQVNALGLTMGTNSWTSPGDTSPLETLSTGVLGNYLIIAARLESGDRDDNFKIRTITATQPQTPAVPEPSTLLLFGSGLAALGLVAMKKANNAKQSARQEGQG